MRRPDPALADRLFDEPYLFDFFQAVRLLEKLGGARGPVGHDSEPSREAIRFVGHVGLSFPPSPIDSLERGRPVEGAGADGPTSPPRMTTTFLGLIGASGALPTAYTQNLIAPEQGQQAAPALAFLDLFHHRLVSLFYRAWEKYHIPALLERGDPEHPGRLGADQFTRHLLDLVGLTRPLRDSQDVPDGVLAYYSGFFAQQHRPAVSLELLLADHFGHEIRVLTFTGQWLALREDQRSRMGGNSGAFNRLGLDAIAGRKVWDDQGKFRVRVGPLGFEAFLDFLPEGRLADELMALIRAFVRGELNFDVQLVLEAEDVPRCRLSKGGDAARLGRTSWLHAREFVRDAEDAVVRPPAGGASRSGPVRW